MSLLVNIWTSYKRLVYDLGDERVRDFPLMVTPWPSLTIVGLYLYFVLKLGPALMANRKPVDVNRWVQIYDLVQIVVCSSFTIWSLNIIFTQNEENIFCAKVDYTRSELAMKVINLGYIYYLIKILDLMDTVFIVLRKKSNQLTFLHLFHHSIMILVSWFILTYYGGGTNSIVPVVNSFVHAIMYTYYFLANVWPETRNSVGMKKRVTQLQIFQFFVYGVTYSMVLIFDCQFSKTNAFIGFSLAFTICALFMNFYWKTYIRPTHRNEAKNK